MRNPVVLPLAISSFGAVVSAAALVGAVLWAAPLVGAAEATDPPAPTARSAAQWGQSPARNNASEAKDLPVQWNVGEFDRKTGTWLKGQVKNVRWVAKLGGECYSSPVAAGGRVYCGTNNEAGYLARYPAAVDLGCLLCFAQADGRFLWQHSMEKLKTGQSVDYPKVGLCCSPLVEGDRLWTVTSRGEVVCLDTEGFADGENNGPFRSESGTGPGDSDVVWSFDMMRELGSVQRYMCSCSVTAAGDLLLVLTGNGRDPTSDKLSAPQAPSFIALDKRTGKLVWADGSPGENILDGQWSSPTFAVLGGVPQAIFAGGDGWLYSFEARAGDSRKPKLLWKFDCNPKASVWEGSGSGDRNTIISTPVVWEGRVYIATGQDPESGEGQGDLWCIDPTRRGDTSGDTSSQLVVDRGGKPVPPRRLQAVDKEAGEQVRPNPNSAAIWHYRGRASAGEKPDAKKTPGSKSAASNKDFQNVMHRSLGMPVIEDGLLVIGDFSGLVHCLDAKSGRVHWVHDVLSAIWGSPLAADGRIYLGDQDGDVLVFELSPKLNLLAKNAMGDAVYGTPFAVGNVLYVATASRLFALGK